MTAPRLEINLTKISHNTRVLVERLGQRGITTTGITKAFLGLPAMARVLVDAGVCALGDARIENIESMRLNLVTAQMILIRSPLLSQAERVVRSADLSFNTEPEVIAKLSAVAAALDKMHGVVLMVELGDLREGIMPANLASVVLQTLRLPNIILEGIGTNLACRSGVTPDSKNMTALSDLADAIESEFQIRLSTVTGGNSSNLKWAFSAPQIGRVNNLRLGESILLGQDPLQRKSIRGLHKDAITFVAEVIESKLKPTMPWGEIGYSTFGQTTIRKDECGLDQAILAAGHQDIDVAGIQPPAGLNIVAASSDHLVVRPTSGRLTIGSEFRFQPNYSAILRAMTSPFVVKEVISYDGAERPEGAICETITRDAGLLS
ncbi:MAG: alanine/ornithine racemase family PLP-dependent enzyme [Hyphomicrobiaceae bacterium]